VGQRPTSLGVARSRFVLFLQADRELIPPLLSRCSEIHLVDSGLPQFTKGGNVGNHTNAGCSSRTAFGSTWLAGLD
jgi:hypothetical protein